MRSLNALLLLAASLILTVAGLILAIELIAAAGDSHDLIVPYLHWWHTLNAAHWNTGWVTLTALAACAAGAALVAVQIANTRTAELELRSRRERVTATVERRALERTIRRAVNDLDGVERSTVRLQRRQARVTVRANVLSEPDLDQRTRAVTQRQFDVLDLNTPLKIIVRISPKRTR